MKTIAAVIIAALAAVMPLDSQLGEGQCLPPKDDGRYSAPYKAIEHPNDYPVFAGADKPGWSCSYQRKDGVIVQSGDSRTPQEQWLSIWGDSNSPD